MQFVPVPGLKTAGRILLNIWDAIQMVEVCVIGPIRYATDADSISLQTNRQASLRLTERCADILISIRGEIADVGYTVAEELRAPIGKLVECVLAASYLHMLPSDLPHHIGRSEKSTVSSESWASALSLHAS